MCAQCGESVSCCSVVRLAGQMAGFLAALVLLSIDATGLGGAVTRDAGGVAGHWCHGSQESQLLLVV